MRRVRLTHILEAEPKSIATSYQLYRVFLGNNLFYGFEKRSDAERFLVETSEFLTEKLLEANSLIGAVQTGYRTVWPMLDTQQKKTPKNELYQLERQFAESITGLEKSLSLAAGLYNVPKANYYVFNHLIKIGRELVLVLSRLYEFMKVKGFAAPHLAEMRFLSNRAKAYLEGLENYQTNHPAVMERQGINTNPKWE